MAVFWAADMLTQEQAVEIRILARQGESIRQISRRTGLSRNTVAKWLHGEVDGPPKYRRGEQPNGKSGEHEPLHMPRAL